MKLVFGLSAAAVVLLAGCSSMPGSKDADDHVAHHPPDAAAAVPAPADYDRQMKMMQEMHQKMAAAKTPEQRAALMKDHRRVMQDGMAMMGRLRGGTMRGMRMEAGKGAMPMDVDTMKRRMDMMEMMMQMMMDREETKPPATE